VTKGLKVLETLCPPGNHWQWYGQQKLTAKSIKPTPKKQNTIYATYIHMHTNVILTNK